jgi:glycosyltransferase involved in cell wall biosynthesis
MKNGGQSGKNPVKPQSVIIVGPPWVRCGTTRVMQNQIAYYRQRGYRTIFVAVAIQWDFWRDSALWDGFKEGVHELGADDVVIAALDRDKYVATKYAATLRHAGRGTALDWVIDIARSSQLLPNDIRLIRESNVALIHVNHVFTLGFARRMRRQWVRDGSRLPMIVDTHDVQSRVLLERGDLNPWTKRSDTMERSLKSEKSILKQADVLVHCSVDDLKFFEQLMRDKQHVLTLPAIDEAFISAANGSSPALPKTIDLLLVAASHAANLAAVKWLLEQVWPRIADRRYNLKIVGDIDYMVSRDLPRIYEAFRSCFVGRADDLPSYYRAARCVIAPMVSGTGISVKTIEALSLGKPFVGTSKAFRGMPLDRIESAGLRAHDDPQSFADAITCALADEQTSGELSRTAYNRLFSLQVAFASRDEAIRMAASRYPKWSGAAST